MCFAKQTDFQISCTDVKTLVEELMELIDDHKDKHPESHYLIITKFLMDCYNGEFHGLLATACRKANGHFALQADIYKAIAFIYNFLLELTVEIKNGLVPLFQARPDVAFEEEYSIDCFYKIMDSSTYIEVDKGILCRRFGVYYEVDKTTGKAVPTGFYHHILHQVIPFVKSHKTNYKVERVIAVCVRHNMLKNDTLLPEFKTLEEGGLGWLDDE